MVELTGNSLSKRHQELNNKVNEAAANNVNFEEKKVEPETSDVDRLFKIDLAAKYNNVDYIIETFKSGDPLYISRALKKAPWLYDDAHSNIINTDHLHHNVFPFTSTKMKKKILTAVSIHLKDKNRIEDFYNYCLQLRMTRIAQKFLVNTSESFKLEQIQDEVSCIYENDEEQFLKSLLEESFELFEAYLKHVHSYKINSVLQKCCYFYTVSNEKYLDLLEQLASIETYGGIKLGLRISKDIVTKHKDRVLANPKLYVNILQLSKLIRHSNVTDAKMYAISLLPEKAALFWKMEYYKKFKPIIDVIPEDERYGFVKKIFADNYPQEEFEMSKEFYNQHYHDLMSAVEREAWALDVIAGGVEIVGQGRDHILYKYVRFEKAFVEIKKLIKTAIDQAKRLELLKVSVRSAKTQRELETLFNYFYQRHVNEKKSSIEVFIKEVISAHNVFEFDADCWEALNKIFLCLGVYNTTQRQCNPDFKIVSILYHIINSKEMPDALIHHIEHEISIYSIKTYLSMLEATQKQHVYTYITNFYLERILKFPTSTKDHKCIAFIHFTLEFMMIFKKTKKDIPESIMEFVKHNREAFRCQQILQEKQINEEVTDDDFVRYLKEDYTLLFDKDLEFKKHMSSFYFRLNKLLQKLKIYFSGNEITQHYLKLFNDGLNEEQSWFYISSAVYGFLKLSDEKSKIDFMNKFAPADPKIDYSTIDRNVLHTREAICRFACYSRPPVPLSNILMYLKGDYVKYCLPMFHMYLANLPQPLCLKFVESLLDAPVSIQKHGLRLAFKCFNTENLNKLVVNAWKGTKNVSLRSVIYKAFYEKTVKEQDKEMFETLKVITLDLNNEDDDDIFFLITTRKLAFPGYEGDFVEAVWATVENLKDNEQNLKRKTNVIKLISDVINLMKKDTIKKIVHDGVDVLFSQTLDDAQKYASIHLAKWELVVHYIVYFTRTDEERSESVAMAKLIISKCLEGWNKGTCEVYAERQIYEKFIQHLKRMRFLPHPTRAPELLADVVSYENATVIFDAILNDLQAALPLHEIYIYVWDLRIALLNRRVVKESRTKFENDNRVEVIEESATEYGKQLGLLVKEFVQNNIYVSNMYCIQQIVDMIDKSTFDFEYYLASERKVSVHRDHILVAIARGLLQTGMVESNLLALYLLPVAPKCNLTFYKSVYDAIKDLPDMETKSCLYQKFCSDHKVRKFE